MNKIFLPLLAVLFSSTDLVRADYEIAGPGPDLGAFDGEDSPLWSLWIRGFAGYDNNVQEVADKNFFVGDQESWFLGATINGSYKAYDDRGWLVGLYFRFDQTYYTGKRQAPATGGNYTDDVDDFNLTVFNPAILVARRIDGGGQVPVTAKFTADYRYEDAQTGIGGNFYTLGLGLSAAVTSATTVDLFYHHGWDDFDVVFIDGSLNDRDGTRDRLSLSATHTFNEDLTRLRVEWAMVNSDSNGDNFEYDGHELATRLESVLAGPFAGALEFIYGHRNYNGFVSGFITPPGRTEMDLYTFGAELVYAYNRWWTVDAFYRYTSYQSNSRAFDSNRTIVGVGLRRDF